MNEEHSHVASSRFFKLAQQFRDKEFRDTYVAAHTRRFLARQMRKFRSRLSQTEFAEQLGKHRLSSRVLKIPITVDGRLALFSKSRANLILR
jgi:hypothetical protein